jgi:hypothetical protein
MPDPLLSTTNDSDATPQSAIGASPPKGQERAYAERIQLAGTGDPLDELHTVADQPRTAAVKVESRLHPQEIRYDFKKGRFYAGA